MRLSPESLNFVGYTYKNFEAVKGLRRSKGMCVLYLVQTFLFSYISSKVKNLLWEIASV